MSKLSESPPTQSSRTSGAWELPPDISYREAIVGHGEVGLIRLNAFDWSEHYHAYAQIVVPLGPLLCDLAWRVSPNDELRVERLCSRHVGFIAADTLHAGRWQQKGELMVFFVRTSFLERVLRDHVWSGLVIGEFAVAVARDPCILLLTELCSELWRKRQPTETGLIEGAAESIVLRLLLANFAGSSDAAARATVFSTHQQAKITDHIHKSIERPIERAPTVNDLARLVGLSSLHFIRVFKNTMGVSPKRYYVMCVMRRAAELLRSRNFRVEEVANRLGYDDPSYFGRVFRRVFTMSPTQYQEFHREKTSRPSQG